MVRALNRADSMTHPPKDGAKLNGSVWLDGKPVALDLKPHLKRPARAILRDHLADQRAYIARLTASADRVERYLCA